MSSVANCHNHSTSAAMSESDNDEENAFDSSYNRQNESMMHKVKDVVSKLLHPSFLFSTNDDASRPKRKRSTSIEEHNDEQQQTTNGHTTRPKSTYDRSIIKDDEPQITDDEDNNSRDVPSNEQDLTETEQQKKRRRTANYQHILSTKTTNSHHNDDIDERTSSPLMSTDSVKSLSNLRINQTTPVRVQTLIEQSHSERLNRLTASKQRFNILPTYRGSTSNYDPSKSPLFSSGNRKPTTEATTTTTTNLKSNEFSANHLLASGLISRPQPSSLSNRQQSPATLSNPIPNNNSNRILSNERQMFGVNYASINSRRLPYIERLRRRTLEDCVRLNQTADNEPLSRSIIEEHKSTTTTTTTASPVPKRTRAPEKECGIQCDILTTENSMESNKKNQRTFPSADIQNEAISGPSTKKTQLFSETDSLIQTDSSITIERVQSPMPTFNITKPKVLGNVTPFSWPKFARAQEEYAKKYPEKCRSDAVVPSTIPKSNVNINLTNTSSNANINSKLPIFPFTPSRPVEAIWKCPSCTKEHPAQTASCSLCRGMNPNYKKLSAIESTKTIEKQPVLFNKLPDVIAKEPSIPTPSITNTKQTTPIITKENVSSIPSVVTTSAPSTTFPPFGVTSTLSLPITTKENPVVTSTAPLFGTATSDKTVTASANSSIQTSTAFPPFVPPSSTTTTTTTAFPPFVPPSSTTTTATAFPPFVPPSTTTTTTAAFPPFVPPSSTTSTTAAFPPFVPPSTTTTTAAFPPFVPPSTITTTTAAFPPFVPPSSTTTTTAAAFPPFVPPSTTTTTTAAFPPFVPPSSTSATTAVASSTVPSITTVTPTTATSISFGAFSTTPIVPTTTAASVVSTIPSSQSPASTFASNTSAPSLTTSTFPVLSTTSAFTTPGTFAFGSAATTSAPPAFGSIATISAPPAFGSGGLNFLSASTTTTTTTTPSNPPFTFSAISPSRSLAPTLGSPMNSTSAPAFGTIAPFGTSNPFGTNTGFGASAPFGTSNAFGTTSTQGDRPPNSIASFSSSGTSNTPPSFGFGATSNTTQASTVSTGGFTFTPSTSTAPTPVFGASPPPLSNPFGFGTTPTASPINNLFQFSAPTSTPMVNPPFSTPIASQSTIDSSNLFSIGSGESSTERPILKARRRRNP